MELSWRSLAGFAAAACVAFVSLACGSPTQPPASVTPGDTPVSAIDYQDFQTAVAGVPRRDFQLYWLGPRFAAAEDEFYVGFALGDQNDARSISLYYKPNGPGISLDLSQFSAVAWPTAQAGLIANSPPSTVTPVTVNGHSASLIHVPLSGRPNLVRVQINMGDAVVVASTGVDASHRDATPNPNPLVDEATLLEVLSHLRPYPQ